MLTQGICGQPQLRHWPAQATGYQYESFVFLLEE